METTIPLKNIEKLFSKTSELTQLLENTDISYKETQQKTFKTLPVKTQVQLEQNFLDNMRKLDEIELPIKPEELFSKYIESSKSRPEFFHVGKLAKEALKAYEVASNFREYYLKYFKDNKIDVEFNYIIRHPKDETDSNYNNMLNHKYVLNLLVNERRKSMESMESVSDFDHLDEIRYKNTAEDAIRYKFVEKAIFRILQKNANEFLREEFYDLPIETTRLQGSLKIARILSDVSVEGVVWSVGSSDEGVPPFATMKYGVNRQPDPYNPGYLIKDYNMIHELVIGFILNTIRNLTPNFMYVWAGFSCNAPKKLGPVSFAELRLKNSVKNNYDFDTLCSSNTPDNLEPIVLSEVVDVYSTFSKFFDDFFLSDPKIVLIVLFQIFASLSIAQDKFRFVHGDLHANNILIKRLDEPTRIVYNLGEREYGIETEFVPIIIDYGLSRATYQGRTLTMLSYMGDFRRFNGFDQMFQVDPNPDMFMPLYDAARLLQGRIGDHDPLNIILNRGVIIEGGIGTLRKKFEMKKFVSPSIFQTFSPHPMRRMSINLYDYILDNF